MFRKCTKRPLWPLRPFLRRSYGLYSTCFSRHKSNTLVANIWHSPLLEITSIKGARTHSLFTVIQISFLMRFYEIFLINRYYDVGCWIWQYIQFISKAAVIKDSKANAYPVRSALYPVSLWLKCLFYLLVQKKKEKKKTERKSKGLAGSRWF